MRAVRTVAGRSDDARIANGTEEHARYMHPKSIMAWYDFEQRCSVYITTELSNAHDPAALYVSPSKTATVRLTRGAQIDVLDLSNNFWRLSDVVTVRKDGSEIKVHYVGWAENWFVSLPLPFPTTFHPRGLAVGV